MAREKPDIMRHSYLRTMIKYRKYTVCPVAKPRMTKRDTWKGRPCVLRYWAFRDRVAAKRVDVPQCGWHVVFVMPMPPSWSKAKCGRMNGKPHKQQPDKDNLEKGLLDAVFGEDKVVWDGWTSKVWGKRGAIWVGKNPAFDEVMTQICREQKGGE